MSSSALTPEEIQLNARTQDNVSHARFFEESYSLFLHSDITRKFFFLYVLYLLSLIFIFYLAEQFAARISLNGNHRQAVRDCQGMYIYCVF